MHEYGAMIDWLVNNTLTLIAWLLCSFNLQYVTLDKS